MKTIIRTLVVIAAITFIGPQALAQPAGSAAPAAITEMPPPEGSGSAAGSATSATGSATAPAGSAAAPATGSATPIAAGGGSAAAPAKPEGEPWYEKLANKTIEEEGTYWMPKSVNSAADESDLMFYATLALSIFFLAGITIAVVYLTWKYRHRPGHKAEPSAAHNDALEITWTVIPTIMVVFLFWYGWRSYINVVTPRNAAVEINVLAWRWNWQFTHHNGVTDSDLHVPSGVPVRLVMTSKDVLHAFYAPAMRVKQDVIPRRYTHVWFNATKPGTYRLTCAEYCGTWHAQMACLKENPENNHCDRRAVVVVHAPGDYERYLADMEAAVGDMNPVDLGKKLVEKKGCVACHTVDGSVKVGPSFKGTFGAPVTLSDGSKVPMDENYIRESLMSPQAKARQNSPPFPPSMPSFEGQLKPKEIEGLIAYIKSLK
jgi:cytochrome c oxidase subunit 2